MNEIEELQAAAKAAETAYTAANTVCVAVSTAEQATVLAVAKKVVADAVASEALDTQAITDALSVIENAYTVSKAITDAANRATDTAWYAHVAARDAADLY